MKRKVLSVLFATILTAGMLAGCGSTENSSDKSSDQKEEKSDEDTSEGQKGLDPEVEHRKNSFPMSYIIFINRFIRINNFILY